MIKKILNFAGIAFLVLMGIGLIWAAYDDYYGESERIKNCLPNVKAGDVFSVVPRGIPGNGNVYEYQKIVEVEGDNVIIKRSRIASSNLRNDEIKNTDFFRDEEDEISLKEFKAQNFKDAFCN